MMEGHIEAPISNIQPNLLGSDHLQSYLISDGTCYPFFVSNVSGGIYVSAKAFQKF